MLQKVIDSAIDKALNELVSYIKYKTNTGKKEKKIQHQLELERKEVLKSVDSHLTFLSKWCSEISILGMLPKKIEDIYIEVNLTDDPRKFRLDNNNNKEFTLGQALSLNRHLFILGDPGAGKTTLLKKLSYDLLRNRSLNPINQVPILFRFRDFQSGQTLISRLIEFFGFDFRPNAEFDKLKNNYKIEDFKDSMLRSLSAFLNKLNVVLLLDGLDELNYQNRNKVLNEILRLSYHLNEANVIITCRSADLTRNPENFIVFEIKELYGDKVATLANNWFGSDQNKRRTASDFLFALKRSTYQDLSKKPLTLINLCLVFEKSGRLPKQPLAIYQKILNLLLEEWDDERGVLRTSKSPEYAKFDAYKKKDFLSAVAFFLITDFNGALSFSTLEFSQIYNKIYDRFNLPERKAKETAREIESHTGIIVKAMYNRYEFSHKSLQEFLVAEYILRLRNVSEAIVKLRPYPNELAISVARSSDPSDWFCGIFRERGNIYKPSADWLKTFIYRLLMEQPGFTISNQFGMTCLLLLALSKEIIDDARIYEFFAKKTVNDSMSKLLNAYRLSDFQGNRIKIVFPDFRHPEFVFPRDMLISKPLFEGVFGNIDSI